MYDKSLDSEARVKLLNVLSVAALKDDVILLLHQDRREHTIMNFAFDIDRHPSEEQQALAQFVSRIRGISFYVKQKLQFVGYLRGLVDRSID